MNFSLSLLAKDWRSFHLRTYCLFYSFILKVKSMRTTFWPLIFILLLNLNQRVGASTCSCSTGCWLQDPSNYDMWRPSHQDEMLAVNIPANHRYIHICTCHRPLNIFTYHVHVACLRPDLYIWRWRGRRWSYRREHCQARDHSLRLRFNIRQHETTGYFRPRDNFQPCLRHQRKTIFFNRKWGQSPELQLVTKTDILSQN